MDKIKLAQRTIALLSSMIESGECHTARTKEMKTNALNGLNEVNNLLISGVSQQRELLNDFVSKYNASTEKFEGISEDSVDCYFKGIL